MKTVLLVFIIFSITFAYAEWSSDAGSNNQISGLNGDQTIPKTAQNPDGSSYIGWWSNSTGNYNMRLQYLDIEGDIVWEQNGILVSDHDQMSWLTDWDMTIDLEGNAIMAINDIRINGDQLDIIAYKISPAGEFIWGEDGINLSLGGFNAAPVVTVSQNNNCIFAWADEAAIKVVSITPEGGFTWDSPIMINEPDTSNWPQLVPATNDGSDGNFLLKYYVNTGPYWSPNRAIFMQKYNADGEAVWDNPAIISNAYGISAWTQTISVTSDGEGGAIIAWHDDRNSENTARAYVQHITSEGTAIFGNGILAADHAPNQMYYPSALYQPEEECIYVYWRETDAGQNNAGIIGQKINTAGELLYTNSGITISPIQTTGGTITGIRPFGDDIVCVYTLYPWGNFNDEQILAERLAPDGNQVWAETLIISNMQTQKLHLDLADVRFTESGFLPDGGFILSWGSGNDGIFAQRFNDDGTIGAPPSEIPFPPQNVVIDSTIGLLSWSPPPARFHRILEGYNVYLNGDIFDQTIETSWLFSDLEPFLEYTAGVSAVYTDDESQIVEVSFIYTPVSFDENDILNGIAFLTNYPNPFNPSTSIIFFLPHTCRVELKIYNLRGQLMEILIDSTIPAGRHEISYDARDLPSGVYLYLLQTPGKKIYRRMVLLK
jgi:hypothetical protein